RVKSQKFETTFNWKITLASGVFLPLLIGLGFWQLNRAQEKQLLLDQWYVQQALPPVTINNLDEIENGNIGSENIEGRNIEVRNKGTLVLQGKFDQAQYWLLEHRFYKGKLGYEVLMVFHTMAGEHLLVNRGW